MKTIAFRTDANAQIATGHLMRCLAIACACAGQGCKTIFYLSDDESAAYLRRFTARDPALTPDDVIVLQSDFAHPEKEIPALAGMLKEDALLLDTYFLDADYAAKLKRAVSAMTDKQEETAASNIRIAKIDDSGEPDFPADLIVNYLPDAKEIRYTQADLVLAGMSYAPLRRAFAGTKPPEQKHPEEPDTVRILLTTGGTDAYGMSDALESALRELTPPDGKTLSFARADGSVADMASLMTDCDLAVTAGGTTLIELCACGVPAVVFATADNQLKQVKALAKRQAILYAGSIGDATDAYVAQEKTVVLQNVRQQLASLLSGSALQKQLSETMRGLVDGDGAKRIAAALATSL